MKGSLHQIRMHSPLVSSTLAFPFSVCPNREWPFPFQQHYLYFRMIEEASSCATFWVKTLFSQVIVFFCQISSGNQVNCFHEQILEDKDWILLFFHVPVSLMSLAGRSVDVALILCNLDIMLCKTALEFGVLWNQITSSPAFLSPSLWSVKYPLIWQCWSAAALPDGSGQQAAHESSRCFTCLGQWKPYGPFFLHLLPGANVSTADIWMFAMQQQRQEKAAELCWAWCCIMIVVFFQSSLRGLFTNVMLLTCS